MDSYIKFIECAGGRAVPLLYDDPIDVTFKKMEKLNGVFYCGGDADEDDKYYEFGKAVFFKAIEYNDKGSYYPVWGTCLGEEEFVMFIAGGKHVRGRHERYKSNDPMKFIV